MVLNKSTRAKKGAPTKRKAQKKHIGKDLITVLLLIVFFPVGIARMMRAECRWRRGVKYAISSALICLAAAAIVILPNMKEPRRGGIELVGPERDQAVFGPEKPEQLISDTHISDVNNGVVLDTSGDDEGTTLMVYASNNCYHLGTCRYAYASSQHLTLYQAYYLGFKPCNICKPPEYVPEIAPAAVHAEEPAGEADGI